MGPQLEATVVRRALELSEHKPANCFLAINVDPLHLVEATVRSALRALPNLSGIVLELTEHREVADMKGLQRELDSLRQRGAAIAMDDAGSGYSGLKQVLELRPQLLKIDRELVTNVNKDAAKHALIQMLGELAGRLDAWLLAEGVENEGELAVLRQLGVPLAQGYFLARPAAPWTQLLPEASDILGNTSASEQRLHVVRRLLEPCATCGAGDDWPDEGVAVKVTDDHRPVALRFMNAEQMVVRSELELLRVKDKSTLAAVAQRATTRSERLRWDPLVCIDETGRFRGIVRMHRLVYELAGAAGNVSLDSAMG